MEKGSKEEVLLSLMSVGPLCLSSALGFIFMALANSVSTFRNMFFGRVVMYCWLPLAVLIYLSFQSGEKLNRHNIRQNIFCSILWSFVFLGWVPIIRYHPLLWVIFLNVLVVDYGYIYYKKSITIKNCN